MFDHSPFLLGVGFMYVFCWATVTITTLVKLIVHRDKINALGEQINGIERLGTGARKFWLLFSLLPLTLLFTWPASLLGYQRVTTFETEIDKSVIDEVELTALTAECDNAREMAQLLYDHTTGQYEIGSVIYCSIAFPLERYKRFMYLYRSLAHHPWHTTSGVDGAQ